MDRTKLIIAIIEDNKEQRCWDYFKSSIYDPLTDMKYGYFVLATIMNNLKLIPSYYYGSCEIMSFLDIDYIDFLIQKGADVNEKDCYGSTPLIWAVFKNNINVIKKLIKYNVNINDVDEKANTALNYAVQNNNSEIVKLLLKHGADPSIKNILCHNAFDIAINNRYYDIAEIIINYNYIDWKKYDN